MPDGRLTPDITVQKLYYPQQYFDQALLNEEAKDSLLSLALNGAEGKYGFLDIIEEYNGMTV